MKPTRTIIFLAAAGLYSMQANAQTMNICTGKVTTAVTASADMMNFTDNGSLLTVGGKTFSTSQIDSIYIDNNKVEDATVRVIYNGDEAKVIVAGNIAPYLTTTVNGAHVSIIQDSSLTDEITYTLEGSSNNGSFWMDGKLKASLVLNNLTLTCADSAAINIRDGKRISVQLPDGTESTLKDGASGSQKACFAVKGHTEFKGGGTLNIYGNAKHAFSSNEYVELKKTVGTINILSAQKDGMNIGQYLEMKGGTVNISGVADDGIQIDKTDDDTDEQNGQALISGGTLTINVTGEATKGIKCEDSLFVSGGAIQITTSGAGQYDSSSSDTKSAAGIKSDGAMTISGGTLTIKSTGTGGKGLSSDGDILISDGTINITTTGKQYSYNRLTASPKGIRADGNLTISGGDINVSCTGGEGSEGIESKNKLTISGGNVTANTYDDALNASNNITISGGKVYACATGNDGIDSNGTLTITGGLVIASGTRTPEDGFDCDQNTFTITGGTLIGIGGGTSTPTSSVTTQPVYILGGQQFTKGSYISLTDASGNMIWAFQIPQDYSQQATLLISSPSMSVGSSYTINNGVTVSGGTLWNGYSDDTTVTGGSTLQTFTQSSMITSTGNTGGGPGGNPGGGPGGNPGGGPGGGGRPGGH